VSLTGSPAFTTAAPASRIACPVQIRRGKQLSTRFTVLFFLGNNMYVQDGCVDVACASTVQCVGLFKSCLLLYFPVSVVRSVHVECAPLAGHFV